MMIWSAAIMNGYIAKKKLLSEQLLFNKRLSIILWFGLSSFTIAQNLISGKVNNFVIYRYVFYNTIEKVNLYLPHPEHYEDVNLYGPVFSVFIAPFAILPVPLGCAAWVMSNVVFLYYAFRLLPIENKWKNALLIFCSHEMMNNSSWLQTNAFVCGCLLLGFAFVDRKKEVWALFLIMLATFIKVYGLVGLAFFLFSKQRWKFIGWALFWSVVFFLSPLLITSWDFLIQSYHDWHAGLSIKAAKNVNLTNHYFFQDISVMGMIRRIIYPQLNNAFVLIPAALLMLSQLCHFKYYSMLRYRLYILSSLLIFVVIFSTGSESPTYIIALPGICIWYILQPKTKLINIFFAFALLFTTFSYSDLLTPYFRTNVAMPYSLKALPSTIVWIIILVQIHSRQFLLSIKHIPWANSLPNNMIIKDA